MPSIRFSNNIPSLALHSPPMPLSSLLETEAGGLQTRVNHCMRPLLSLWMMWVGPSPILAAAAAAADNKLLFMTNVIIQKYILFAGIALWKRDTIHKEMCVCVRERERGGGQDCLLIL